MSKPRNGGQNEGSSSHFAKRQCPETGYKSSLGSTRAGKCFPSNFLYLVAWLYMVCVALLGYEPERREFESLRARQKSSMNMRLRATSASELLFFQSDGATVRLPGVVRPGRSQPSGSLPHVRG